MNRTVVPGAWLPDGARPFLHRAVVVISGQGDHLATPYADTELACDVAPDADRQIAPPPPLSDDLRSRLRRRALYLSALAFSVLAGLLEAFGANPFDRFNP